MTQPISIGRYGLAYLFWAITVALAFVALLVWRSTAFIILGMTPWDRYIEHALNQFGFLLLAIIGLSVIIFAEYYYRTGKNNVWRRFLLLSSIEVLVIALAHGVQWIGGIVLDIPISPLFFVIELGLGILLIVLYRRSSKGILLPNL
jgi:hypothetical protein